MITSDTTRFLRATEVVPGKEPADPIACLRELVAELFIELQLLAFADPAGRSTHCKELQAKIGALVNGPAPSGAHHLYQQAAALGMFLQALSSQQEGVTDSNLRTVASAADVLEALSRGLGSAQPEPPADLSAVVLDPDEGSQAEVSGALVKVGFDVVSFRDPDETLQYLESSRVELVVLNVPVPVPQGFDVSKRVRALELHEKTPILVSLVGRLSSAGTHRAFLMELVVKALNLVYKNRVAAVPSVLVPITETHLAAEPANPEPAPVETPPVRSACSPEATDQPEESESAAVCELEDETTFFLHQAGAIVAAQPSAQQLFGWEHEELVGVHMAALIAPDWQAPLLQYLESHAAGQDEGQQSFHLVARRKDSTDLPVYLSLRRLGSDSSCQWTAGFRTAPAFPEAQTAAPASAPIDECAPEAIFLAMREAAAAPANSAETQPPLGVSEIEEQLKRSEALVAAERQRTTELEQQLVVVTAELDAAKSKLDQDAQQPAEADWSARVETANSAAVAAEKKLAEETVRREQVEAELASQRASFEKQLAHEHDATQQARAHAESAEKKLTTVSAELDRAKSDLEQGFEEQERLQCEWMGRLNTLKTAFAQAETATEQKELKSRELESELQGLRGELETLNTRLAESQEAAANAADRNRDLESKAAAAANDIQSLQKQVEDEKAHADALKREKQAVLDENKKLQEDLVRAREAHQPLEQRLTESENKLRDRIAALARAKSELEQARGERSRADERAQAAQQKMQELHRELEQQLAAEQTARQHVQELEKALQQRDDAVILAQSEARSERAERELAEEQLKKMGDLSKQYQAHLDNFESAERELRNVNEDLQRRLRASESGIAETRVSLEKESRERQELEKLLADAEQKMKGLSDEHGEQQQKVASALRLKEKERKQLERSLLHARQQAIQSARESGVQLLGLRRELEAPARQLRVSVQLLLESELPELQKTLAEGILEQALLVQNVLQSGAEPEDSETAREPLV